MHLTVLGQLAKGIALRTEAKETKKTQPQVEENEEEPSPSIPTIEELEHQLERIKCYLWHGSVFRALQIGEDLEEDLDLPKEKNVSIQKMLPAVREFNGYITVNENYIVNYGDRYRNWETISTAFVESTVNEVISKRFLKKQQMLWTKEGTHHLFQVRIQVLNDELQQTFCKWYPGMLETPIATENDRAA
ncbi:MAG: hypothetical protein NVSMB27_46210 [Ktedonobacteraceae bacterium]